MTKKFTPSALPENPRPADLLTMHEVASILRVTPETVNRWRAQRVIPGFFNLSGRRDRPTWRITRAALTRFLETQQQRSGVTDEALSVNGQPGS
jgi:hypothetical protein